MGKRIDFINNVIIMYNFYCRFYKEIIIILWYIQLAKYMNTKLLHETFLIYITVLYSAGWIRETLDFVSFQHKQRTECSKLSNNTDIQHAELELAE